MKSLLPILVAALGINAAIAQMPRMSGEAVKPAAKSTHITALRLADAPASELRFVPMDAQRIREAQANNLKPELKALQIGIARDAIDELDAIPSPPLRWQALADGGYAAQFAVTSPGALGMRVNVTARNLVPGSEIRVLGSARPGEVLAATEDEVKRLSIDPTGYWTPYTQGETQTIEIFSPGPAAPTNLSARITSASHIFASASDGFKQAKALGDSGPCNVDVICATQTPALVAAKNSVAMMIYQTSSGSSLCTGTLLNDMDASTQTPYFYSANHCISTQTQATTLNTVWFFERASCGAGASMPTTTIAGGATLLYTDASRDALLLRLNRAPPAGATLVGWDANTVSAGTALTALHHPAGDAKKITLGQVIGFDTLSGPGEPGGSFITTAWTSGTTEGGSSGSGIFTLSSNEYFLRGGLFGGSASCSNAGAVANTSNRDYYSRFDQVYPSIRQFLEVDYSGAWANPTESGWGISIVRLSGGTLGIVMYHFKENREPIWYFMSGGSLVNNVYAAPIVQFAGPGVSAPTFAASSVTQATVGNVSITFLSPTSATMTYTITGAGTFTKQLAKLP